MKKLKKIFNYEVTSDGIIKNNNEQYYIIRFEPISILGYEDSDYERLNMIMKKAYTNISGKIQMVYQKKSIEKVSIEKEKKEFTNIYYKYLTEYNKYLIDNNIHNKSKYYLFINSNLNTKKNIEDFIEIYSENNIYCDFLVDKHEIEIILFNLIRME